MRGKQGAIAPLSYSGSGWPQHASAQTDIPLEAVLLENVMLLVARLAPLSATTPVLPPGPDDGVVVDVHELAAVRGCRRARFCCVPVMPLQLPVTVLCAISVWSLEAIVMPPPQSQAQPLPEPTFMWKPLP